MLLQLLHEITQSNMKSVVTIGLFLAGTVILPILLDNIFYFVFARKFIVHSSGIIVITGASTGIGRHAAEYLATMGFEVYAGVRSGSDADAIVEMKLPHLHPLLLDVTSPESCQHALDIIKAETIAHGIPLVALVNNAGIARRSPLEFHRMEDLKTVYDTNVFGLLDITQKFLPLLRLSKGRIVIISSIAGKIVPMMSGAYSSTKHAVEAIGDGLRRELADFGIAVSIVEPGLVKTPIIAKVIDTVKSGSAVSESGLEQLSTLYGKYYSKERFDREIKRIALASEPVVTSEAIYNAIVNPKPRARYGVANASGIPAWILLLLPRLFPDRVLDAFIKP